MSSGGHFHRRWGSAGAGTSSSRRSPSLSNLSSSVEPSTYGTSWNSVRWNKPAIPGHRSLSSRMADSFERNSKPSSYYLSSASSTLASSKPSATAEKYLTTAAKVAANLASLGPSVTTRASRFDSTVKDNYRSQARDIISKYTSKERPSTGYYSRHFEPQKLNPDPITTTTSSRTSYSSPKPTRERESYTVSRTSDYPYRKSTSLTPTRTVVPALSRYASSDRSITSPTPSRSITSPGPSSTHVLRQERPWRQRMAEGARVRAIHGDDVSQSYLASRASRRGSVGKDSADELSSSISALRTYVTQPSGYRSRGSSTESTRLPSISTRSYREPSLDTVSTSVLQARSELAEATGGMSRSYSPIRSAESLTAIPRFPTTDIASLMESRGRASSAESTSRDRVPVASVPREVPIKEEEPKEDIKDKKRSARERSLRHASRQSSQAASSSDDENFDREKDKDEARKRRRASRARRSNTRELRREDSSKALSPEAMRNGSEASKNGNGGGVPLERKTSATASPRGDLGGECPGSPGPLSPKMGAKLTKSASARKMVPTKKQITKSPSYVEVPGTPKSPPSTGLVSPTSPEPSKDNGPLSPSIANMSYDEIDDDTDAAPIGEDESLYNAVVNFKPGFKPRSKPSKPVPGLWKKEPTEENISKNKSIDRPTVKAETSTSWTGPLWMSVKKKLHVKNKATLKKEKEMVAAKSKEAEKKAKEDAKIKEKEEKAAKKEEERLKKEEEKRKKEEEEKAKKEEEKQKKEEEEKSRKEAEKRKKEQEEKIKKAKAKEAKPIEIASNISLKRPQRDAATSAVLDIYDSCSVKSAKIREKTKKKVKATVDAKFEDKSKNKKTSAKCENTLKQKSPSTSARVSLQCSSSTTSSCSLQDSIAKKDKDNHAKAKVHVVSGPVDGVTMSRVRLRIRAGIAAAEAAKRQSLPIFPAVPEEEISPTGEKPKTPFDNVHDEGVIRSNSERDSRAAAILNELRINGQRRSSEDAPFTLVPDPSGPLVLPDKSILEEYVKRKRGKLEELHNRSGSIEGSEGRRSVSPTDSVCSDLFPAPEVRIFANSPRHSAQITTPSRRSSCSRLSSVEASTPTAMLDTMMQPPVQVAASYNTPGFLRHGGKAVTLTAKPLPFDAPKTPFEASLQKQATQIRNKSEAQLAEEQAAMQRSGTSVSSSFTAAVAASQRPHERYAAHLPLRSGGDGSGRTSAASIDSTNSGALDTASRHLDNMIDQARYRHQAHRSKFKEAIDYLDNIFEDLKKEVDPSAPSTAAASPGPPKGARKTSLNGGEGGQGPVHGHHSGVAAVKTALQRENAAKAQRTNGQGTNGSSNGHSSNGQHHNGTSSAVPMHNSLTFVASTSAPTQTNSLPNRSSRHHRQGVVAKEPSPVEVSIKATTSNGKKPSPEDLEVSETLVLPRKTDKLDFTRRWLHDDLSGFTKSPPNLVDGPANMYSDPDEHSLGSCSAEVAAINSAKAKKRRESKPKTSATAPDKPASASQAEKRAAPYRPQPVYGHAPAPTNGARFPVEAELLAPPAHLARVSSYDRLSERMATRQSDIWRSGSQEPYQTLGSARSDDASRPSPSSAFMSVPNTFTRGGAMRGSIRSLPDAGLVIKPRGGAPPANATIYYPEPRDPAMAIDALVAELELNTDQGMTVSEKRRSFPTSMGTAAYTAPKARQQPARVVVPPAQQQSAPQARYAQPAPQRPAPPASSSLTQQPKPYQAPQQHQPVPAHQPMRQINGANTRHSATTAALDEVTNMLATVSEFPDQKSPRKTSGPFAALAASSSRPFDTINQERINPSRVEAIQNMFENRRSSGHGPHSGGSADWRHAKKNSRDEDSSYFDFSEYSAPVIQMKTRPSPPPHRGPPLMAGIRHSPHDVPAPMGAYPTTAPPSGPPPGRNGSAGSSQNGGYYSSNSSCAVGPTTSYQQQSTNNRRGSLVGRQSMGSRGASIDDEDDGFYDNIGIYGNGSSTLDDRRFSRGSELGDNVSMSSARLPPKQQSRLGSFLTKLAGNDYKSLGGKQSANGGGMMRRPPGSAASLVSLNKVAMEAPIQHVGSLAKSSSLSNDPWRKQIIEQPAPGKRSSHGSSSSSNSGSGGFGARLKNSLFGSKKRLNH